MTVYNTNLMYIIQSELIKAGKNEFLGGVSNHQSTAFDDSHAFIKKAINFDDDIKTIVNLKFFTGVTLKEVEYDTAFKRSWLTRFLHDSPKFQTLELFASNVTHVTLNNIDFLNEYYENILKYMQGVTENKGDSRGDTRVANATLPQTEVNINVDNTILQYADDNMISRVKNLSDGSNKNFNIDNLLKAKELLNIVFDEYDKKCFMQIW